MSAKDQISTKTSSFQSPQIDHQLISPYNILLQLWEQTVKILMPSPYFLTHFFLPLYIIVSLLPNFFNRFSLLPNLFS